MQASLLDRLAFFLLMKRPKWPETLVIIRHGQSKMNVPLDLLDENLEEKLLQQKEVRDMDIPLTERGVWQSNETGLYLREHARFDVCIASPYLRTMQTAEGIIGNIGYPVKIFKDNRLREKEFGRLHGYTTEEIMAKYPEEFFDRERDGKYWYRLPRGENYPDVEDRVHGLQDKLVRDYCGKNVLVITHQVPYLMFRALYGHLDEQEVIALGSVPNCGIQEYHIDKSEHPEGRMHLVRYNEVAYDKAGFGKNTNKVTE
jgi:2,3-bisphosphoglycerate-dependent phosphoglycerate mutase